MKNSESEIVSLVSLTGITPAALETIAKMPKCFARDIAKALLGRGHLRFIGGRIVNYTGREFGRYDRDQDGSWQLTEQPGRYPDDYNPEYHRTWDNNGITIAADGTVRAFTSGIHWIRVAPDGSVIGADRHYGKPGCGFWGGLIINDQWPAGCREEPAVTANDKIKIMINRPWSSLDLSVFDDPEVDPSWLAELMVNRSDCPIKLSRLRSWDRVAVMECRHDCQIDLSGLDSAQLRLIMIARKDCPLDDLPNMTPLDRALVMAARLDCPINLSGMTSYHKIIIMTNRLDCPIDLTVFNDQYVDSSELANLMICRSDCPIDLSRLRPWERAKVMVARPDCQVNLSGMNSYQKIMVMSNRHDCQLDLSVFDDPELDPWQLAELMTHRPDCPINLSRLDPWQKAWVIAARPDCPVDLSGLEPHHINWIMLYLRNNKGGQ